MAETHQCKYPSATPQEVAYHFHVAHRGQAKGVIVGSDDNCGCIIAGSRKHSLR